MRQLVLEKIVISGFPPVNKRCLWLKGNTFYYWYKGAWRSIDSNIDVNEEYIDDKVSETVSEELSKIVGDAPEEYDTIGEMYGYMQSHEEEASQRDEIITANTENIAKLEEQINSIDPSSGGWTDVS